MLFRALHAGCEQFHDFVVDVGLETKDYKFDVREQKGMMLVAACGGAGTLSATRL